MPTQKQIAANRANAQKSTGPRTPEGRARVRCNALRHGLTGQILTLTESDRPIFDQILNDLLADFKPYNALERQLATGIAWDTWRLNRLRAIESNTFALGREEREAVSEEIDEFDQAITDACTFRDEADRFDLLSLYETRLTRNLHKNTSLLRNMQRERKRLYEEDKKEEVLLNRLNEINNIEIQASKFPSKNGFVFSDEEIARAVVRQRYLEKAKHEMSDMPPFELYGSSLWTHPDTYLMTCGELEKHLEPARTKIHGVSPESIAIRRLRHPEEFYEKPNIIPPHATNSPDCNKSPEVS
jgi:hypothetical protein